jgi:tetratricopeptide (TPR) repeat protein
MFWKRLAFAVVVTASAGFSAFAAARPLSIPASSRPTLWPPLSTIRGYSFHGKGEFARAIQDYSHGIKLMPDYADAYSNRGADYNNLGRYDLAIRDLNEAIKLEPRESVNFKNRSFSYAKRGDYQRALADLERAVKLNHERYASRLLSAARGAGEGQRHARRDRKAAERIKPLISSTNSGNKKSAPELRGAPLRVD